MVRKKPDPTVLKFDSAPSFAVRHEPFDGDVGAPNSNPLLLETREAGKPV